VRPSKLFLIFATMLTVLATPVSAASGKISKVLAHYLDLDGRHTLSPSLYERDAYQAQLRKKPEQVSTMRFDVNWSARHTAKTDLKMRLEIRSTKGSKDKPVVIEQPVKPGKLFSTWTALTLSKADYDLLGEIIAWRATLWQGDEQLAEQRSFLW
jgi:hypothetical protein